MQDSIEFTDHGATGIYYKAPGVKAYVVDGTEVDRETWLAFVSEHQDQFSDPKWTQD